MRYERLAALVLGLAAGFAAADPLGGKIGRDPAGNPSGILEEDAAYDLVKDRIPAPTAAEDVKAARTALDTLPSRGLGACHKISPWRRCGSVFVTDM